MVTMDGRPPIVTVPVRSANHVALTLRGVDRAQQLRQRVSAVVAKAVDVEGRRPVDSAAHAADEVAVDPVGVLALVEVPGDCAGRFDEAGHLAQMRGSISS